MLSAALILFAFCVCLAVCGADQKGQADPKEETKTEEMAGEKEEPKTQTKAEDDVWRGIAPGMEELRDITERTEYMDVAVEPEVLFDNDLKEMVSVNEMQGRPGTENGTMWPRAVLGGGRRKGGYLAVQKGQQQGASGDAEDGESGKDSHRCLGKLL